MNNKLAFSMVAAVVISIGMTSCSTTPEEGKSYNSIDELRNDFEAAGGDCPSWVQTDQVTNALQSGECDDSTVLSIYGSTQDTTDQVVQLKEMVQGLGMENHLLVGPNWIVNSPDFEELQKQMGGITVR